MKKITDILPDEGVNLVKYSKDLVIDKLGMEVLQNVVSSILTGSNVRDLTEGLTQRRTILVSSSLLIYYLRLMAAGKHEELTSLIKEQLKTKLKTNQKAYLLWFLGITGKSFQNVIRDEEGFTKYLDVFDKNLASVCKDVKDTYGDLTLNVNFEGKDLLLKWPNIVRCLLAVGSSTLSIRGSEKSLYGKMFEKLVMGSVLSLLGFEYIDMNNSNKTEKVFWLSEREDKREADATILIKKGVGIRIDIGFIGEGNTEISLDKVSRFEREMEFGNNKHFTSTYIFIDKIGSKSRIKESAKAIGGEIIQMSETYWVYGFVQSLYKKYKYRCELTDLNPKETNEYIREKMKTIDLSIFNQATTVTKKQKAETKPKKKTTNKSKKKNITKKTKEK